MRKGSHFSEELKKKLSRIAKDSFKSGQRKPWNIGIPWSEETKQKMKGHRGEQASHWQGGKIRLSATGYVLSYCPDHPFAMNGRYVYEHRLVMERFLGRYLMTDEQVHHRNGVKDDNRLENLQIVSHPHFGNVKCPYCLQEFLIK